MIQKEHIEMEYVCEYCSASAYSREAMAEHEKRCLHNPEVQRFVKDAVGQWFRHTNGNVIYIMEYDEEYYNLAGYEMHDSSGSCIPFISTRSWAIETVREHCTELSPSEGRAYFETVMADLWGVIQ